MKKTHSSSRFFWQFVLFNLCFFILQLALMYSQNGNFMSAIPLPIKVYLEFAKTLGVHISLYLLLSLIQTFILIGVLKRSRSYFSPEQWQIIIWALCVCTILSSNAYYFPLSQFSLLFSPPISEFYIRIIFYLSSFSIILLLINGVLYRNNLRLLPLVTMVGLSFAFIVYFFQPVSQHSNPTKPNIIILGIDSLSPDSINTDNMPFFSQLLKNSTQFSNTISPLARTYPAWASILTGLYAKHHHAEENLISKRYINNKASIVWTLNQQGYNTIYATDDRRFNTIDTDFGFKKIIGPRLGVNDVLLGTFNDFPLSNLLINSQISAWFFPYNYSNRASFFSYYPETFNQKLKNELSLQSHNKPIFLAVHFTLPHWPYAWAESSSEQLNNEFSLEKRDYLYQESLKRVDKQFHKFFTYLKKQHYLTNSLVIILSDHGEALFYPNSRLTNYQNYQGSPPSRLAQYLKAKTATVLDKSAGHGSDILSPKQYQSVLAFNIYVKNQITTSNNKLNTRVALLDLAPTILDFLHLQDSQNRDGISLLPAILNSEYSLPQRTFFIESGMFPNQKFSKEKTMRIGKELYHINPITNELEIKNDKLKAINQQKLYGVIEGEWVLALYPDTKTYIPVIQNLSTGEWNDDLHSSFAQKTPASQLVQQLQQFYGDKLFLPLP